MGEVFLAGEETDEGAALFGGLVADGAAEHWILLFQRVEEGAGAEIHSDRYKIQGSSKANKLRAFWRLESDYLVGKLLL